MSGSRLYSSQSSAMMKCRTTLFLARRLSFAKKNKSIIATYLFKSFTTWVTRILSTSPILKKNCRTVPFSWETLNYFQTIMMRATHVYYWRSQKFPTLKLCKYWHWLLIHIMIFSWPLKYGFISVRHQGWKLSLESLHRRIRRLIRRGTHVHFVIRDKIF